ncbi:MAG: tRNA pseudouridine(55) synthase TruB [Planctomycetaceae bacterium]
MKRRQQHDLCGLLNINKSPDMSSRQALNAIERLIGRGVKVGHAGTLDPIATGVLVVCLGKATRLVPYIQEHPKVYRAEFLTGLFSPTDDIEVESTPVPDAYPFSAEELVAVLPEFVGVIDQVPPAFSAVKVDGHRAYDLARKGIDVDIASKRIEIGKIDLLNFSHDRFSIEIQCGSGTYVRALGRDIARKLGSSAVMSKLERTAIGPFRVDNALTVEELSREQIVSEMLPLQTAVPHLPTCTLNAAEIAILRCGRRVIPESGLLDPTPQRISILDESSQLIAIGEVQLNGYVAPRQLLIAAQQ